MFLNNRKSGQVLVVQAVCMFLIVALFMHSLKFAEALEFKQRSNLSADLVAVSAARVQAENLQLIAAINNFMVLEMKTLIILLIANCFVYGALTSYCQKIMNSINNLSNLEEQFIKITPILMYWEVQRIARANGFAGAFMYPVWPKLPLKKRTFRMIIDSAKMATDNPWFRNMDSMKSIDKMLRELEAEDEEENGSSEQTAKIKGRDNKKNYKQTSDAVLDDDNFKEEKDGEMDTNIFKKVMRQVASQLNGAHYLNDKYVDSKITVFCFDADRNIRISSARVSHATIPRDKEVEDHGENNYLSVFSKPTKHTGFLVELVAVDDYMEQIPQVKKAMAKFFKGLKEFSGDFPLNEEHFSWIQH